MLSHHSKRKLGKRSIMSSAVEGTLITNTPQPSVADYDTDFTKTVLLIHGDGSDNGTNKSFIDASGLGKVITPYGDVTLGTFSPFAVDATMGYDKSKNIGSAYFDGVGDYLDISYNADMVMGSSDFTIEGWLCPDNFGAAQTLVALDTIQSTGYAAINMRVTTGAQIAVYVSTNGTTESSIVTTATLTAKVWSHFALVRNGTTFTVYINGASSGTPITVSGSLYTSSNLKYTIGACFSSGAASSLLKGYLSNLNIIKGAAKYTSNFSVPTAPVTAHANTKLLLNFDNANVRDETGKHNITLYGDTKTSVTQTKWGTSAMYFDGTGDGALLDGSSDFTLGTGDFTIEMWVYRTVSGVLQCLIDLRPTSGNGAWGVLYVNASNQLGWDANSATFIVGTIALSTNTWHHVCVCRTSGSARLFLDGVQTGSTYADPTNYAATGVNSPRIGSLRQAEGGALTGYIDDLRIKKGQGLYASNFTPPSRTFPNNTTSIPSDWYNGYWDNTVLLLSMDYVGSSTIFQDNSKYRRNPAVGGGTPAISNTQSKFGGWSGYFNGSSYLLCDGNSNLAFGTGDFTIEMWVNLSSLTGNPVPIDFKSAAGTIAPYINIYSTGLVRYGVAAAAVIDSPTSTFIAGTWTHIAVSRVGGTSRLFVNGVVVGSASDSNNLVVSTTGPRIGAAYDGTSTVTGYIDELRVTKGVGRYTQTFIPPQSAFAYQSLDNDTYWSSTNLLIHADGANNANNAIIVDSSGLAKTVTRFGDVAQGTRSPFPALSGAQYNVADNIGSAYFDGTGDYLNITNDADFNIAGGAFTIEAWVNLASSASDRTILLRTGGFAGWNSTNGHQYLITVAANTNYLTLQYWNGSALASLAGTSSVATSTWKHIAITRDGTTLRLFVDGVQQASAAVSIGQPSGVAYTWLGAGVSSGTVTAPTGIYFTGYIANFHIAKGTAKYTGNFSLPAAPATPIADTKLLLNFTNAAVFDHTGKHNLTVVGDTKTMVAQNKYGGSSLYFDGAGDYILLDGSTDFAFGTGDFTIECWVYPTTSGVARNLLSFQPSGTNGAYPALYLTSGNALNYNANSINAITGSTVLSANNWYHIVLCRIGTSTRMFLNGVQEGSTYSDSTSYLCPANRPVIGVGDTLSNSPFTGYIDDLRITKGVGRYNGNFTIPTQAFPNR